MADDMMKYKYVVKNVARQHGMTATFMPKPLLKIMVQVCTFIKVFGKTVTH